jgi:Protein of unknown function (DUF3606)
MSDDKTKKRPEDSSRISLQEEYEVKSWCKKFNVSEEKLRAAVKAVGHMANDVEKHLKK